MTSWRAWSLTALIACGARTELRGLRAVDASADAKEEASSVDAEPPPRDGADDAPVLDASTCLALPTAACTCGEQPCSPPNHTVLNDAVAHCSTATFACGYLTVTFDANGCALSFGYEQAQATPPFRTCLEDEVSSQRWPCEMDQPLLVYLGSCSVH